MRKHKNYHLNCNLEFYVIQIYQNLIKQYTQLPYTLFRKTTNHHHLFQECLDGDSDLGDIKATA